MEIGRRYRIAAAIVLAAIWMASAGVGVVLIGSGFGISHGLAALPALAAVGGLALALVASLRRHQFWDLVFRPTVVVPRWGWLAVVGVGVSIIALSMRWPITPALVASLTVMVVGLVLVIVTTANRPRLRGLVRYPWWIVLGGGGVVVSVVAHLVFVEGASVVSIAFFLAIVLFGLHVTIVMPLSLWEAHRLTPAALEDEPPVTVLIPAYNEAGIIGGCIDAVLDMAYPSDRLEVLVIDDGSTDRTYAEAAAYRDRGVRVIRRENGGKHAALNLGVACSNHPIIATIDADSRPTPGALRASVATLLGDDTRGAVSATVIPETDDRLLGGLQRLEYAISNTILLAYSAFDAVPVVPGCFGVYRRSALESVWGFDPDTMTEDFDVTIELLRNGWTVRHGTATVWTIAPGSLEALWHQRLRWNRGSLETIRKHWEVLTSPEYGYLHGVALPARTVLQLCVPPTSFLILLVVSVGLALAPTAELVVLIVAFLVLTLFLGLFSVILFDEPLWTAALSPLMFIGYKHFIDATVLAGSIGALLGWGGRWDGGDQHPRGVDIDTLESELDPPQ